MLQKMMDFVRGPNELWETLESLAISREPVRIEIENSLQRFTSQVAIAKGQVVFMRPEKDTLQVSAGDHVRAMLPGADKRELRLEVVAARMRLGAKGVGLMCKPAPRIVVRRRAADRYNVRRYSNIILHLREDGFRIADLSQLGCKLVLTPVQTQALFPVGDVIRVATLAWGENTTMRLERLIPRSHAGRMIGCEFAVRRDGESETSLQKLISSLDKAQDRRAS
jgi:hypothetical protein